MGDVKLSVNAILRPKNNVQYFITFILVIIILGIILLPFSEWGLILLGLAISIGIMAGLMYLLYFMMKLLYNF